MKKIEDGVYFDPATGKLVGEDFDEGPPRRSFLWHVGWRIRRLAHWLWAGLSRR